MKRKMLCVLGLLFFLMPIAFGAENVGLNPSVAEGGQKDPFNVTFRPGTELLSKSVLGPSGNNGFDGEALPVLVSMTKPIIYPGWARRKGLEGSLVVALEILDDGSVGRWQIIRSTGEESLDKAAAKTFVTWKFQPAMKNGKPVRTCIQVPVNFELTE